MKEKRMETELSRSRRRTSTAPPMVFPNTRLYLPATAFDRYAMTREINDGLLAFAPGQRGYVKRACGSW